MVKIKVGDYDDSKTILSKFSITVPDSLPSHFRILNLDKIVPGNVEVNIEDIRDLIKSKPHYHSIPEVLMSSRSFGLSVLDTLCIWYIQTKPTLPVAVLDFLGHYNKDFSDINRIKKSVDEFQKRVDRERARITKKLEVDETLVKDLGKAPDVTSKFLPDSETFLVVTSTKLPYDLVEIFDNMRTGRKIPFAMCKTSSGDIFYKVYEEQIPPESWYKDTDENEQPLTPGIYFRTLAVDSLLERNSLEKGYSLCIWRTDGTILVDYNMRKSIDVWNKIKTAIYESFEIEDQGGKYKLEGLNIETKVPVSVSGTFVYKINYNPYIFAYLISLDRLVSRAAFINETENTEPKKIIFRLYLSLNHSWEGPKSLQFNIIPLDRDPEDKKASLPGDHYFSIRIRHCPDIFTARAGIRLFAKIVDLYHQAYPSIAQIYSKYPSASAIIRLSSRKKAGREEKKTKSRLAELQKHDQNMFRTRYSDQCQSESQPYVVAIEEEEGSIPNEVKALRSTLGRDDKVMKYEGVYYACEVPGAKNNKKVFPGLKKNTDTKTDDSLYREDYPCLPCCFLKPKIDPDQDLGRGDCQDDTSTVKEGTYISKGKDPEQGKYSDMPNVLIRLANVLGVEMRELGKNKTMRFPHLKFGVVSSPKSFVHALVAATNFDRYVATPNKEKMIDRELEKMLDQFFSLGKQQFFDTFSSTVKKDLGNDPQTYIDPSLYVSIAEGYFKVNIILIQTDDGENKEGEFLYPRASLALLPQKAPDLPKVVIFRQKVKNGVWPYQCSLLRKLPEENSLFYKDPFVDSLMEIYQESWQVYSVSHKGHHIYQRDLTVGPKKD